MTSKPLNITIVSDKNSWINTHIAVLKKRVKNMGHLVDSIHSVMDLKQGDIAFFLGCGEIIPENLLMVNTHNLVVHGSALPLGKGWSPLTWQILEGKNRIMVTLFEAEKFIDSGDIYLQEEIHFTGYELVDDLRKKLGKCSIRLCKKFIENYPSIIASARTPEGAESYYRKRSPEDSRLDPDKTLREQFNLMRVADNTNYPLYFEINNYQFELTIKKKFDNT